MDMAVGFSARQWVAVLDGDRVWTPGISRFPAPRVISAACVSRQARAKQVMVIPWHLDPNRAARTSHSPFPGCLLSRTKGALK